MAPQIGYQLSSEEHRPADLVRYARMAEEHGFDYATMSIADDPVAQTHQCFRNIAAALEQAGCARVHP